MKLNKLSVNNYLNEVSPEDQRKLLEAFLEDFQESLSNLKPTVLDYPKEKALHYISETRYNILHNLLPRDLFYSNEEIREYVNTLIPILNQKEILKVYSLLLKISPMSNVIPKPESE